MLYAQTSPAQKRRALREQLASGELVRFPGAFNPLSARLIERAGFEGVYISGAVISADLGLPDIGLTTLTEVAGRGQQIARMTELPAIIDADTGFGEPMNVARTIQTLEDAGLAGTHIEDQVNPKRCGHLDGKSVVDADTAIKRIRAAVDARRDPDFLIMARTDVRAVEGLDAAIDRAKALVDAGADAIFPEAMRDLGEFEAMRTALDVPILANMTEFGKSELFSTSQLRDAGVNIVIWPVSLLRLAMGAAGRGLGTLASEGHLREKLGEMQHRGLAGVTVDYTAVSKVNPGTDSLLYRGYPVQELAATQPFEAVALLLWNGELPDATELAAFEEHERAHRDLDPAVKAAIDLLPLDAHPMDVVRTAVSVLGASAPAVEVADNSSAADLAKAKLLFAKIPAMVAYDQRRRRGQELVEPRADLDYSSNFLYMTFGELPEEVVRRAFTVSMILYAEHSFNASTFTARVITSTTSDLYSAVVGAIGALKGALHGGANEAVMHIFDEIGDAANVGPWLDDALATKRKIMGFGHRVYKRGDSRVPKMKAALDTLVAHYDATDLAALYDALEADFVSRKGIHPNLDYPSGPAYHLIGFDTLTFTPLFVAARVTGWTAHILEQTASNALIRPLSAYNGVDERHIDGYVPDSAARAAADRPEEAEA
ncbi:hypothetical protein LUZ63_023079 [Rhynchospora breviuscula]|uniref:Citrate synthase n=1 Tax=Rhynchospora breviuscula TaxID=2022672 RepID=A0A9Q0BX45_9POAL|nr:hypothetical protein LUZ63_023079 [Rhynchospora breviuscula]